MPSASISSASSPEAAIIISTYRSAGGASPSTRARVCAKPDTVASGVRRSWHASETRREKAVSVNRIGTVSGGMDANERILDHDLQASKPDVRLGLSRAGVTGVSKAIRIRYGDTEKLIAAEIESTVDLDPAQKGVHMSRFPELFAEAIEEVVIGEAFLIETLADHIARHIVARQRALRAEVRISARYPLEKTTPVTGLPTQEMVGLMGIAAASERGVRRVVGVEAILELVPLATHNQRGRGTLYVGSDLPVNAEQLVRIVEGSMSAPVYELLKRPDELFVVEHAHLQPRFVEDS